MKKLTTYALFTLALTSILVACGNTSSKSVPVADSTSIKLRKDSLEKAAAKTIPSHRSVNRELNDMARYIAGMPIGTGSTLDSSLLNNKDWKNYCKTLNETWQRVGETKINKMKPWVDKELNGLGTQALFYPFAGADFMNAVTLFPHAKNYYMVGLEPVGTPPDLKKIAKLKDIGHYFNTVNQSLESILNFSFFRTKSMAVEFHQPDVNGTIHVLLLFLERTGNSVIAIQPVRVNSKGDLIVYKTFAEAARDSAKNQGAQIDFLGPDSLEHSVTFFSINLSNPSFEGNGGFKKFIKDHHADVTYIKSASYLMHKVAFSDIRSTILSNSRAILQDDSGIPWKLFNDTTNRNITLYGAYTGTIDIFPSNVQSDLDAAYKHNPGAVKPLPFGIGYKYREGESNLMLSVKKSK